MTESDYVLFIIIFLTAAIACAAVLGRYHAELDILDNTHLSELKIWMKTNDPDLYHRIGTLPILDGTIELCNKYGLTAPKGDDIVWESSLRILRELIEKTGKQ